MTESLKADSLIGASTVLGPKPPPGVKLMTEEDQNILIEEWQENIVITEVETDPGPVEMKLGEISRDGKVGLGFNQKMIVPDFIKNIEQNGGRRLGNGPASLEEVNMASIIDVSFALKSDVEENNVAFYILLLVWTELEIQF